MKNLLTIAFICFILFTQSCVMQNYGSTITLEKRGAATSLKYKSYTYLVQETKTEAKKEMWEESRLNATLNNLPKGGYVIVTVKSTTIGSANTKYWTYIIQDLDGTEILRKSGTDQIASYTVSQYGTIWYNIDYVGLYQEMPKAFKVFIIDELSSRKSEYTIYPNQE